MDTFSPFWDTFKTTPHRPPPTLAFADPLDLRVIKAVRKIKESYWAHPQIIGNIDHINALCQQGGIAPLPPALVIEPSDRERSLALSARILEGAKKITISAEELAGYFCDPLIQGIGLLAAGEIDGLIAGSTRPTAEVVKAALQWVGTAEGYRLVSGQFFIETKNRKTAQKTPFLFSDCAVVPEPSPRSLALIAKAAADSYHFFTGQEAKVAFLSFSTKGSASHELVDRITEALTLVRRQAPGFEAEGEIQVDAALDREVARLKHAGSSNVAGEANVFVFPTLESGNIGYKLIQRFAEARIAGPLLWGLKKPMSDLSRGCTVQEIIDTSMRVAQMIIGRR